ncbi:MAG: hypothetical protein WC785_06455 [Tatlockia sp.]|jgi:hypothetical protein
MSKDNLIYDTDFSSVFFGTPDFEEIDPNNPVVEKKARNALRTLIEGRTASKSLFSWKGLKSLFSKEMLPANALSLTLQQGLDNLFVLLQQVDFGKEQIESVHQFLAHCLSTLPEAGINPQESLAIPTLLPEPLDKSRMKWERVLFKIVPIELTPSKGFNKLFIPESHRIFAYGLEPITHPHARSHLIFTPATQSFATKDIQIYRMGRGKLHEWFGNQQKVKVCGRNLGASLALLSVLDKGDKITRVDAMNPRLFFNSLRNDAEDNWSTFRKKPAVFVHGMGNEREHGVLKPDWQLLQPGFAANPEAALVKKKRAGGKQSVTLGGNVQKGFWSVLHFITQKPYVYLLLPVIRYVSNHKLLLSLCMTLLLTGIFLPASAPAFTSTVLFFGAVVPVVFHLAFTGYKALLLMAGYSPVAPKLHDPNLSRNASMDLYSKSEEHLLEANLTPGQLADYYQAKNLYLKERNLFAEAPDHCDKKSPSKYAIAQHDANQKERPVWVTKAKLYDIHKTLHILSRHGFYKGNFSPEELKIALEKQHESYRAGK